MANASVIADGLVRRVNRRCVTKDVTNMETAIMAFANVKWDGMGICAP